MGLQILEFGHLIRTNQISAKELTGIFLKRLK
nr:glutamyl-tRNA(Gln) amidotransferase subunit A isoform X2 [Tanacetum cinerariifolium]